MSGWVQEPPCGKVGSYVHLSDLGSLPDAYDEQVALCAKLESAETELVRNRVKARIKAQEKLDKEAKKGKGKQKQMLFTLGSFPT